MHYALTACDRQGRLADRSAINALGWEPHQRVAIEVGAQRILVQPDDSARQALTREGFLRLPAAVRHRYGMRAGDRLLLAAVPDQNALLICFAAILDDLLAQAFGSLV
ncbi:AbrB/MazE/SpoVT family DNA-binding domain-containing protein [Paractinoplanes atraurantiacus]|uniref:AbrB/MazE/SpoVT family DNA-binding domain-containing protein n=1 Tax=Paractinoplanes atraurantiacus TaxID=1036182 RepID=UPI0011780AE4|nr:AbrB/MazE/SpoVT family DNA-binding domain-containing protein [Actinoplanes atraurantiacus]